MKVLLVTILQAPADQARLPSSGKPTEDETWLGVSGVVERRIAPINSDVAGSAKDGQSRLSRNAVINQSELI
jgi:hypothetical protein